MLPCHMTAPQQSRGGKKEEQSAQCKMWKELVKLVTAEVKEELKLKYPSHHAGIDPIQTLASILSIFGSIRFYPKFLGFI